MPRVTSPIFVGRTTELERLLSAYEETLSGRSCARLVVGEAGIGKTRLVAEVASRVRQDGALVLVGDCIRLGDTGLPYAPFIGALRPVLRDMDPAERDRVIGAGRAELAHLFPDLGDVAPRRLQRPDASVSAVAAQARLFEIVLGLLRHFASARPVLLVLEDLQWAEASTRGLLRFLVRNADDARLLIVGTYRSDELHRRHPLLPLIAELLRLPNVARIDVPGLEPDELATQLAAITGEPPAAEVVSAVHQRSGGNPFYAEELIATGEYGLVLPRSLRDTLSDRVRLLGERAQAVLRVVAVAGGRIDHRLLAEAAGLGADDLEAGIRETVERHLLEPTPPGEAPGYGFRHALLQEAVYEELLPSERTRLHAQLARAIEGNQDVRRADPRGSAAQLAHHWYLAHELDRALVAAVEAGRAAAATYAFPEANALLERAIELWPKVDPSRLPSDVSRRDVLVEAAEAAAQSGAPRRSIELVRDALGATDPAAEPMAAGELHHRMAWYLNEAGDWQAGARAMERAVELVPIEPPSRARARVLADLAHSLMVRGRYADSLPVAEAALATSRAVGARIAESRALNALGLDIAGRSDVDRAIPILEEGYAHALETRDPQSVFLTAVGLGWALDEAARHTESLSLARATREELRRLGAEPRYGGHLASKATRALYELGRWEEADALVRETLEAGTTRYATRWLLSNRIRLRIHRGQLDAARQDLRAYDALGERVVGPDPDLIGSRRAELAIAAGEPLVARQIIGGLLDAIVEVELDVDARSLVIIGLWAELEEADRARAAGRRQRVAAAVARARALGDLLERHAARVCASVARPTTTLLADAALGRALTAAVEGTMDVDLWTAAVDARRRVGRPFELASVLAALAAAHLAARDRERARVAAEEAYGMASRLGAEPLRARLEALARRGRMPLGGVESADAAAQRIGLTRREREVLALVAAGRTNRQIAEELFMSESTAGVHVSHILAKLGASRRGEAAIVAHRMGLVGDA